MNSKPSRQPENSIPANDDSHAAADDPRLIALVAEYQQELQAGNRPQRQHYIDRFPELADSVAACIDGLEILHSQRPASRGAAAVDPAVKLAALNAGLVPNPLGDFQILREIARGGMGIVYEAIQLSLSRRVALKVLPFAATFDSRQLQRFKNEAQAAALLHHTHIVPIYAVGCERGVHFYAMQLIEGQSLALVINQFREQEGRTPGAAPRTIAGNRRATTDRTQSWLNKPNASQVEHNSIDARSNSGQNVDSREAELQNASTTTVDVANVLTAGASLYSESYVRRAASLMMQAADALEHAHQLGVVHRDIKPGNLLIDSVGNLWVTDFGLAQLQTADGLTRSGDFLGTFRYMSPEQMSGERTLLDHRTDIYSLGATFYELLTLEPVFSGNSRQELLYQILHQEPRSLRSWNRTISPELETIVLKSLSKSPAERYHTAAEFAADILRCLNHEPIFARRPTLIDRARKWTRRHPGVVVSVVLLLLVATAAALVSNRLIDQEQRRTAEALEREKLHAIAAEDRFQQARQAVDQLLQVSEEDLVDKPELNTRRRILEIVASFYQDFIDERGDKPASQAELEEVQEKVKGILRNLNLMRQEMSLRLLGNRAVQTELQMSAQQQTTLDALLERWSQDRNSNFEQMRTASDTDRKKSMVIEAEQHHQELTNVLSAAQLVRFKQLVLQWQGISAFKEPEVMIALRLSTEQRTKLRELERESFGMRPPPGLLGGRGPFDGTGPPDARGPRGGAEYRGGMDGKRGPDFLGGLNFGGDPDGGNGPAFRNGPDGRSGPDFDVGASFRGGPPRGGPMRGPPPEERNPVDQQALMKQALALLTGDQLQKWRALVGNPFNGFGDNLPPGEPKGPPPRFLN